MRKRSLVLSALILSQTLVFANENQEHHHKATNISDAITQGKINGGLALYGQSVDLKKQDNDNKDYAYGNAHLTLGYETNPLYGFNIGAEFKGNVKLGEKNDGDYIYGAPFQNEALLSQGFINYSVSDIVNLRIGRQEVDKEWLGDNQEAAILDVSALKDTLISVGYSRKKAETGIDLSEHFYKPTEKGIYFLEVENSSLENITLKPYVYTAPEAITFYGLKGNFEVENLDLVLHYATSNVSDKFEDGNVEDNSILHTEASLEIIENLNTNIGYIKTDKKGGAGLMTAYGDNISPFEDGFYVYDIDARTYYAGVSYSILDIDLSALYGITKYGEENQKEKELNISAGYNFTEELNASVMWVNVDTDKNDANNYPNYNKYLASVEYKF